METLNEQDLDWLTKVENRLIFMRKREAANMNSSLVLDALTETIKELHELRTWLQSRFGLEMDKSLDG